MSLNWREIDRVLDELPLVDCHVRKIVQPDFRNLVLECFRPGESFHLLISLEPRACRIHRTSWAPKAGGRRQRFEQLLRSRLQGGRITSVEHVNCDRIVCITVRRGGEILQLWIRLWGPAANALLTDETGTIIDACFRRPGKNEVSGGTYTPQPRISSPAAPAAHSVADDFVVRELPGEGDFNARLDRHYRFEASARRLELARERSRRELTAEMDRLSQRRETVLHRLRETEDDARFQRLGNLIMANLHAVAPGSRWLTVEDYESPGNEVTIELDERLSASANAERYFRRRKRASAARVHLEQDLQQIEHGLAETQARLTSVDTEQDPRVLEAAIGRATAGRGDATGGRETTPPPGLSFSSGPFRILLGRTAKENDELLRRHTRGNDIWLHARDYPGAYVFVKQIPGKSVPLEVLLDAATLALAYSKGKADGDVYYTPVKYLRRAKHGKTGTVIPTQEKNLTVRIDPSRLARLRGGTSSE
ncbi:MAG: fibronectin-binding domain-containing protein [Spirochaetaceae bacterium]|nr:MAG: fibronectin-binding domain-containing protein [Spirochaetaceae bacterium]